MNVEDILFLLPCIYMRRNWGNDGADGEKIMLASCGEELASSSLWMELSHVEIRLMLEYGR